MHFPKRSDMAIQFYMQTSRRASPPFGWYSFYRPTEDRRLSRPEWLVTYRKITCRPGKSNPDTVIHPSTNLAQRRLTSLIETNALPVRRTTISMSLLRYFDQFKMVNQIIV